MKRLSNRPRAVVPLPKPTLQRLLSYTQMARAGGAVLLAASLPAAAEIIYTPAHQVIGKNASFNLDLNHDGITDFVIKNTYSGTSCTDECSTFSARLFLQPAPQNGAVGFTTFPYKPALALKEGSRINRGQYFVGTMLAWFYFFFGTQSAGSWINVKKRYLGLRFKVDGKNHFGWARLNVDARPYQITATLTGYAYETIPHKSIKAGQTQEAAENSAEVNSEDFLSKPAMDDSSGTMPPTALGALARGHINRRPQP